MLKSRERRMHESYFSERPGSSNAREPSFKWSSAQLGMFVFMLSLSVLFGASLIGFAITRHFSETWRTPDMPALPAGLFGSTALIAGLSAAVQYALVCARRNRFEALTRALLLTFALALAFLAGQTMNWLHMLQGFAPGTKSLYAFTFYAMTGLHALHVVGGFVPLTLVTFRARRKEYTSSHHEGLKLCVQYWHFLGAVWLVLLVALHWGSW
ncbi:MAG TPA: cytochrome c oxidase subunit 3 [Polyangiaceae bacterium]